MVLILQLAPVLLAFLRASYRLLHEKAAPEDLCRRAAITFFLAGLTPEYHLCPRELGLSGYLASTAQQDIHGCSPHHLEFELPNRWL